VVKKQLVSMKVSEGGRLLQALDSSEYPVNSALWFLSEDEEWRLILATPLVDSEGPRSAYENLQRFLSTSSPDYDITLEEVSLLSPRHALFEVFRRAIVTGPGVSEIRFTESSVDNLFIEDALVYRIAANPDWTPQGPVTTP